MEGLCIRKGLRTPLRGPVSIISDMIPREVNCIESHNVTFATLIKLLRGRCVYFYSKAFRS